jgi:hypothetical protein
MNKPAPPGWNKTIDDLFEEMKRGERLFASGDECDWARDYERSLLPASTIFLRAGQIWEALHDCEVTVSTIFAAPGSGSEQGSLSQGERVRISNGTGPQPISVSFLPVRYDALHESLVSRATCRTPHYTGYSLFTKTVYFNEHFRLIEDVA